jgi:hypothetical protein
MGPSIRRKGCTMKRLVNQERLKKENVAYAGTGGVSAGNRRLGFRPAFLDCATMQVHPSLFADGRPAPFHLLDGLPEDVVLDRAADGRVKRVKSSIISGFERGGFFYTRRAAARARDQWDTEAPLPAFKPVE